MRVNFGDRPFVYGEGHAHRNAADIQKGDSAEELVALFEELPFNDLSEDEQTDDGGANEVAGSGVEGESKGMVMELSQTGPLTKMMKSPIATVGENSKKVFVD